MYSNRNMRELMMVFCDFFIKTYYSHEIKEYTHSHIHNNDMRYIENVYSLVRICI